MVQFTWRFVQNLQRIVLITTTYAHIFLQKLNIFQEGPLDCIDNTFTYVTLASILLEKVKHLYKYLAPIKNI